ncbi:MAG: hypothetical protein IJ189_06300 [Clostridia bacterium]|nr:hypothetical protein [Clostridia bacterium]
MKKIITGGFLSIIGAAWALAFLGYALNNLTNEWYGNRLLSTIHQWGLEAPFILSLLLLVCGIGLMLWSCFQKNTN